MICRNKLYSNIPTKWQPDSSTDNSTPQPHHWRPPSPTTHPSPNPSRRYSPHCSHDIKVTDSSATSLRDLLTKTKTSPPPHLTPYVIYEISCKDCPATYDGQTYRPVHKRIAEHERDNRLQHIPEGPIETNKSATAHHSRTTCHTILTATRSKSQLDLTEHAAIQTRQPSLNKTDCAPLCNKLCDPLLPKIATQTRWHILLLNLPPLSLLVSCLICNVYCNATNQQPPPHWHHHLTHPVTVVHYNSMRLIWCVKNKFYLSRDH